MKNLTQEELVLKQENILKELFGKLNLNYKTRFYFSWNKTNPPRTGMIICFTEIQLRKIQLNNNIIIRSRNQEAMKNLQLSSMSEKFLYLFLMNEILWICSKH